MDKTAFRNGCLDPVKQHKMFLKESEVLLGDYSGGVAGRVNIF